MIAQLVKQHGYKFDLSVNDSNEYVATLTQPITKWSFQAKSDVLANAMVELQFAASTAFARTLTNI